MEKKGENIVQELCFRVQGAGTISKWCMKFTIIYSEAIKITHIFMLVTVIKMLVNRSL